jgi:hypothetical protein
MKIFAILVLLVGFAQMCPVESVSATSQMPAVATIDIEVSLPGNTGDERIVSPQALVRIDALYINQSFHGRTSLGSIAVSADKDAPTRADIVIAVAGYGDFTYKQLPLWPGITHYLTPTLGASPKVDDFSLGTQAVEKAAQRARFQHGQLASGSSSSCSGYESENTPPASIRVYHNGPFAPDYQIHVVDFNSYVKHVLPREMSPSWPTEALRAGGMTAKMYAWYWTVNWRKGSAGGQCYDVDSSVAYQV